MKWTFCASFPVKMMAKKAATLVWAVAFLMREDEASLLFYFSTDDTPACLAIDHSFEEYFGVWLDGSRLALGTPADDCEGILVGHDAVAGIDGTVDHRLLEFLRGQFAASDDHIAVASYLFEGNGTGRFLAGGTYPVFSHVVPVEFLGWLSGRGTGCCLAFYLVQSVSFVVKKLLRQFLEHLFRDLNPEASGSGSRELAQIAVQAHFLVG